MPRTGIVYHPRCLEHDTGPGYPENADRLRVIWKRLGDSGLLQATHLREPGPVEDRWIEQVHAREYLPHVREVCQRAPTILDSWDVPVSRASEDAARLAAGGIVDAAAEVMRGNWDNAFVAVRPPGHHAEAREAMGFCIFNNVAIAARYLQKEHGIERVAIVDFDVHHGNGTQHVFEADPSVFYASLHQFPHYPGSGRATERGRAEGEGATLNCPLAAGSGDAEWIGALESEVLPALEEFQPDFLLISAGFDAHADDPLSGTFVSEEGYRTMTSRLLQLARQQCQGRVVSILEGGYHLEALAACVEIHVSELVRPA